MISSLFQRPTAFLRCAGALLLTALLVSALRPARAAASSAPILLIVNDIAPNRFGRYVGEILRAEGLNAYDLAQLGDVTADDLSGHRLVVLAETPLNASQAALLSGYVSSGGRLLALRPDLQLAPLFGLTPAGGTQTDSYLKIDTSQLAGQGMPAETLQIHGEADRYTLRSATALATLYSDAATATAHPAVVTAASGQGRTAAFTYDLAKSVVYTRQGNPANADIDSDGDGVVRTIDLFQSKDGASWIDRDRIPIPQADVQQRLFARLAQELLDDVTPLPQLWYFPATARTMLIPTGDAHANPLDYYQREIDSIKAHGGTMTFYLSAAGDPPPATLQQWIEQGFTFGIHPYASKPDPDPSVNIASLEQGFTKFSDWYKAMYDSPASPSARNHQLAWKGWTDAADIAVAHGIALDTNFYNYGAWIKRADGSWPHGYITGSGQPMRFVRADGTILPLYQQLTELADEHLLSAVSSGGFEQLNGTQAITVSQQLIDASLAGDYAALMTQFHVDVYGFGDPQVWAEGTLDYARSKGVPIVNADQWFDFVATRHDAEFQDVAWDDATHRLTFTLSTAATSNTLSLLLPSTFDARTLEAAQVDGAAVQATDFVVAGRKLMLIGVKAGKHSFEVRYAAQQAALTPPGIAATPIPAEAAGPTGLLSGATTGAAPPMPGSIDVSAVLWAIIVVVVLLATAVVLLLGRIRPHRHKRRGW